MILATDVFLGVAAIIASLATFAGVVFTFVLAILNRRSILAVQSGLQTSNGLTIGQMTQHQYSMAAQDVPPDDRTDEQNQAVAMLSDQEHTTHADHHRPSDESQ